MLLRYAFATVFLSVVLVPTGHAQTPFDLIPIPNGPVHTMAVIQDTLYFGGDFDFLGPRVGPATALDPDTGEVVEGVIPDIEIRHGSTRGVGVALADGIGGVFLGGEITEAGGLPRTNLVHVRADGTVNPDFAPDPTLNAGWSGRVDRLVLADSVLFVIGRFYEISGVERDGFAAIDAQTGEAFGFAPVVSDSSGYSGIGSVVLREGVVLVAGAFDTIEGVARPGFAALDFATGEVLPWDPELEGGPVTHLVPSDDGIYVVGRFDSLGGEERNGMAEIAFPAANDSGPILTDWAPAFALPSGGFSHAPINGYVLTDDWLWLVGDFVEQPGGPRIITPLLRFTRSAEADYAEPVLIDTGVPDTIFRRGSAIATDGASVWISVALFNGFSHTDGFLVGVDAATAEATGFKLTTGPLDTSSPHVHGMAFVDGHLIVSGRRLELGGEFAPFCGAVDLTTGEMLPKPDEPFSTALGHMVPFPDGRRLYIREEGPGAQGYIEVDLMTGTRTTFSVPYYNEEIEAVRDSSEAPPIGEPVFTARGNVRGLATEDRLYLVSNMGPQGQFRLRRIDTQTLEVLPEFEFRFAAASVFDLTLADGWLYVSGSFETVNGEFHLFYARVDPDTGERDAEWNPVSTYYGATSGGPFAFADNLFVIGGAGLHRIFVDNVVERLAAFGRPDGDWQPWNGGIYGPRVDNLQHGDGVFYASGHLVRANGVDRDYLAAFDLDGELLDWPAEQPLNQVRLLVSERHSRVFVSGSGNVGGGRDYLGSFPAHGSDSPVSSEPPAVPTDATLSVYPNPVLSNAHLDLNLPIGGDARVEVYDMLGRRVAIVHNGRMEAGAHTLDMDTQLLAPGAYVVRALVGDIALTRRVTVLR